MKAILGATALGLAMITAGAAPAGAQDVKIYVYGEEGATVRPGRHGEGLGRHMRGRGEHRGMRGRHGSGHRARHHEGGYHSRGHGEKTGHGRGMNHLLDLIELYDQDGDDKVTQAEIDKARADRLAAFDSDGNGVLSLQEYEALWLDAMRERMVDRFQSHDDDGDGQVTVEEFSERTSRLVMRRDRNDDGAVGLEDARRDYRRRHRMRDRDAE